VHYNAYEEGVFREKCIIVQFLGERKNRKTYHRRDAEGAERKQRKPGPEISDSERHHRRVEWHTKDRDEADSWMRNEQVPRRS
jgi:hypothetical protein